MKYLNNNYIEAMCPDCKLIFSLRVDENKEDGICKCPYCGKDHSISMVAEVFLKNYTPAKGVLNDVKYIIDSSELNINNDEFLIEKNVLIKYKGSKEKVVVPEGVRVIGKDAFNSDSLIEVWLPDTVRTLELRAFNSCKSLKEIDGLENVTEFLGYNFLNCESLEEINISSGKVFKNAVFAGCKGLKKIVGIENIEEVCDLTFLNCDSMEEIDVRHAKKVGSAAFAACKNLKRIRVSSAALYETQEDKALTSWCYYAYGGSSYFRSGRCENLEEIYVDNKKLEITSETYKKTNPEIVRLSGSKFMDDIENHIKWKVEGRCLYCGGMMKGLFKKSCADCGRSE